MGCCAPLTSPSSAFSEIVWSHPFVDSFCRGVEKKFGFSFFPPVLSSLPQHQVQPRRTVLAATSTSLFSTHWEEGQHQHRTEHRTSGMQYHFVLLSWKRTDIFLFWRQTIESGFWRIRKPDASRYDEVFLLSDFLEEQREKFGSISLDWHCNFRRMFWIFAGFSLAENPVVHTGHVSLLKSYLFWNGISLGTFCKVCQ